MYMYSSCKCILCFITYMYIVYVSYRAHVYIERRRTTEGCHVHMYMYMRVTQLE